MGICTWNRLAQLQLVTFKIFTYKICIKKNILISLGKKKKKQKQSKQFNLYEKLINAKSNFDFVMFQKFRTIDKP